MHDFDVLLDFVRENQRVAISFSLRKDDGFASVASVADKDVC
jgi:hypothetical protein